MKLGGVANARLAGGGDREAWGAGLFALGSFADSVGLTSALSAAMPRSGERAPVHDRGALLVHLLLVLAGGGEACTDIEHLRSQRDLFGAVGSDSTLYRVLRGIDGSGFGALWGAAATARGVAWSKRRGSGPLVLDIDSTLAEVHSENKQGAAPHYKGGYGFGPMMCSTGDREPLWAKLRPGNAAANDIADHIEVLDAAISMLPDTEAAGHRAGDDTALAGREPLHPGAQRSLFASENFRLLGIPHRRHSQPSPARPRDDKARRRRSRRRAPQGLRADAHALHRLARQQRIDNAAHAAADPPRPHTRAGIQHRPRDHPSSAEQHPPDPVKPTNPPRTPKTQPKNTDQAFS